MQNPQILSRNPSSGLLKARYLIMLILAGILINPMASYTGYTGKAVTTLPRRYILNNNRPDSIKVFHPEKIFPENDKPHILRASYYSTQGKTEATLMLNNKGPKPVKVTPTLYDLLGGHFDIPAITVEANSFRVINISEWASLAGPMFTEGSLQLFYNGPDLLMGAQVRMIDFESSVIFDEQLVEPTLMFRSSQLEGVWWLPTQNCRAKLVLSNTTASALKVLMSVEGISPHLPYNKTIDLLSNETRVLNIREDFVSLPGSRITAAGGISIEHTGPNGALLARGMIEDSSIGYSSVVHFVDPQGAKSSRLHGTGMRLGKIEGEQLIPFVVARNIGDSDTTLNGKIGYTISNGNYAEIAISEVKLRASETTVLRLDHLIKQLPTNEIVSAGLEFNYPGKPGSMIVTAASVSKNRNQVVQCSISRRDSDA